MGGAPLDSELVLILAPSGRDANLTHKKLLEAGLEAETCSDIPELCLRMNSGAALALVDERVLDAKAIDAVQGALSRQADWSDFPIVVFGDGDKARRKVGVNPQVLGNVTFLDRPVQVRTMLAAVQAAIRGRRRQYQVRRAIALREQFLAMLGHELRNPLATIRLAVETMPDDDVRRQRSVIDRQSQHLARLVDDLLDVARVTHGKVVLQRTTVDLCELVRGSFNAHRPAAESSGLSYALSAEGSRCCVDGDRLRLEQIVNNLLTNAIKYTPRGGSVSVSVGADDAQVRLSVVDTGIGMSRETLGRVFELFAQADRSLDRAQGGLGLGLTVVRGLVELHGGSVEARSNGLGHGSEFVVSFPRVEAGALEQPRIAGIPQSNDPRRIIVVDDNEDLREMFETLLASAGHDVTTAIDGPSGLERILDHEPDVALVDLGLPGFDGYELARRVRAAGKTMKLIAVSGYGQPADRLRALAAGFDEHLKKPVAFQELTSAIRRQ